MSSILSRKSLCLLAGVAFAGANLLAQDEEPGGYLFFGTEASAMAGKSSFPIVAVDPKNIFVDQGTGVKKVSNRAPCMVRPALVLTEHFVDVLEMRFNTS